LGSLAVLLAGLKLAADLKKKLPAPRPRPGNRDAQLQQAVWARWAVTIGLAVLACGLLLLVLTPTIDFSKVTESAAPFPSAEEIAANWPRFRGPGGLGTSAYTNVPTNWNGKTNEGILWKKKVPLPGHNSPVVWENRVFVSGADANSRQVYCFDAFAGVWSQWRTQASPRLRSPQMEEGCVRFLQPAMLPASMLTERDFGSGAWVLRTVRMDMPRRLRCIVIFF
ncbi:MAG: hypothetical protein ACYTBJ_09240, partial [Planctomycetota bacterium]